ncbi:ABC transporter ATP-binding protein [Aggregatibacter kilianii]|uniref:ABC transporter ATP-binding protein n=1 Tax=Aggregatibacter kilianii TaxID=2025884 RepID=UPI000D643E68|nr:ABC transporter ATP-binding protein [Aggregatibacter kilianii]
MNPHHQQICQPVAAQLRLSMGLAVFAQGLKIGIWLLMIHMVFTVSHTMIFPYWQLLTLLGVSILYYTCKIKAHDQSHYAAFELEKILRQRLAHKISRLPLGKIQEIGSGGLAKVLCDDVKELHAFVADAPPLKAEAYSTPIFVFIALFWLNWQLATAVAIFLAVLFVILQRLMGRSKLAYDDYGIAVGKINSAIIEYIQGMSTIRTFDAGQSSYSRFNAALLHFNRVMFAWLAKVGTPTRLARALFTPLPIMLFLMLGGISLHQLATLSAFTLFAFFVLAAGLIETMHPYMGLFHLLERARAAIERINAIETLENSTALLPLQTPQGYEIRFEQVGFGYAQENPVLQNITFNVPQNSFTAIIGASGSGKTTLLNLLLRFWDVTDGKITLGGADIRHMEAQQLMSYCSVVFQDNFLFSCSIAENIAYGMEKVTHAQIIAAAKQARIHDFIMTLPEQYQTKVGERGQLLSGGQKQRITIARAFLQNRPILLLDEPTAFSDAKNEADLMLAFRALMQNKTVIMVAHRLSSVIHADQILYLSHGEIIAQGTHRTLLQHSPAYQTLWAEYRQAKAWTIH